MNLTGSIGSWTKVHSSEPGFGGGGPWGSAGVVSTTGGGSSPEIFLKSKNKY